MGKLVISSVLIFICIMFNTKRCSCNVSSPGNSTLRCKPSERAALLNFKHGTTSFDKGVSSSWEGEDCCKWGRVGCDNTTGHVLELHLHGTVGNYGIELKNLFAMEKLESLEYLLELKQLEHLDLSLNNFSVNSIPKFIGSMRQLRYLNLSSSSLGGVVPDELGKLTNLRILDLSNNFNSFKDRLVVDSLRWASGLRELRSLNISGANLSGAQDWMESLVGPIPHIRELHLSRCGLTHNETSHKKISFATASLVPICYLDLSGNHLDGEIIHRLQVMTSLEHLDLSGNNFTAKSQNHFWGLVYNLCNLRSLDVSSNNLQGLRPPQDVTSNTCRNQDHLEALSIAGSSLGDQILSWVGEEFRNLRSLVLPNNMFSGEIPASLSKLSTLQILDLSGNMLSGEIPASLGEIFTLKVLYLAKNNLTSIASSLRFPSNLETMCLSQNQLGGNVPTSIGQLSKLQSLDISNNLLEGTILSEPHFANMSSLTKIVMSYSFLTLDLPSDWVPPFQIQWVEATGCKINGPFPQWLQSQYNLSLLWLSNASISGPLPNWLHTMQKLFSLDLSSNNITGSPVYPINMSNINLANNSLSGAFLSNDSHAEVLYSADTIYLSYNLISGPLPEDLGQMMPNLRFLVLDNNQLDGPIPESFYQLTNLELIDIHNNNFSGIIPRSSTNFLRLAIVNLSYNKLQGKVPCFSDSLLYLHMNDNHFSGEIPSCLSELRNLQGLDIGGNQISGEMPFWTTAEKFGALEILRLRGNKLRGIIPLQICSLSQLKVLDLAHNRLTGSIPQCLGNLAAMRSAYTGPWWRAWNDQVGDVNEVMQGIQYDYTDTVPYLVDIDLSCNSLVGSIPNGITNLSALVGLNLSYNQLSGTIPQDIASLKSLISLDLSRNKLRGMIPISLGQVYSLSHLNLSYNNFSGQIPTGSQLQTLSDPSSYAGNPYLCGDPLPRKCESKNDKDDRGTRDEGDQDDDDEDKHNTMWFYLVVMSGVATGFWGVVGSLVLKRGWRHAFSRRVDDAYDWVCVAVAVVVSVAKLKKR